MASTLPIRKILFAVFVSLFFFTTRVSAQDNITIDTSITYQTIVGWGHGGGVLGMTAGAYSLLDTTVANSVNYQVLDYLTDDLGLTGSRTWEVGPRIDGTPTDDGNCDSINWSKFDPTSLPAQMGAYLVHFQNKVLAKGYSPNFYSSPGYPTHASDQKPWIIYNPGERAQQIWSSSLYMKNTYGVNINYDVIYNEPNGVISSAILAHDIKALYPRMQAQGLGTLSQFPEAVAPQTAWNFVTPVQNDNDLWSKVGRISYHNYGTADPYRADLFNFGQSVGLTTAQTEMGNPTFDDLYADLTIAHVAYWEVAYSGNATLVPDSGLTTFAPSSTFFRLRQVMHYVTPGSVRINATSADSLLHILAFKKNGQVTLVVDNTSNINQNILVHGLPPGTYGLSKAQPSATLFNEVGVYTVAAGTDTLSIPVGLGSWATTLYPRPAGNLPPTIMSWRANPAYIILPNSSTTLSVKANDPENNALTYNWTLVSSPGGSNPVIVTPAAANSLVTGLTVAGNYVFNIDVSDGTNTSSKKLYYIVYSQGPPPVLGACGFRIAAPYGLVFANQGDTTQANIELPTSSVTLQAGISDLQNDDFTGLGTWSVLQQPNGANVTLSATTYIYVSLRSNVSGMTVPGDYVFQIVVTKPGYAPISAVVIWTVHNATEAPVITSITAVPDTIVQAPNSSLLSATTYDTTINVLRFWWEIDSFPAGAHPVFDHQCLPVATVSGLSAVGTYYFTLRAFDDLHMSTKNISVYVAVPDTTSTGIKTINTVDNMTIYPLPFENTFVIDLPRQNFDLSIYAINGRLVYENPAATGRTEIDFSKYAAGIYYARAVNQQGILSGKLIKQ